MKEKTYVMLKPDTVKRKLIGRLISRLEDAQLDIVNMKMIYLSDEKVKEHYIHLAKKSFFGEIKDFMQSGPVVAIVIEGEDAINKVRKLMGPTNFAEAPKGTIRGDYAKSIGENLIHGSDAKETAQDELSRFFGDNITPTKI